MSALVVGIGYLGHASVAWAAEGAADLMQPKQYPAAQLFTFLFLSSARSDHRSLPADCEGNGCGVYAADRRAVDPICDPRSADRGIPRPERPDQLRHPITHSRSLRRDHSVARRAGARPSRVRTTDSASRTTSEPASSATLNLALSPLAFPTIVTPYGIAALIVFLALSPNLQARLVIGAILSVIMLLNLIVMLLARPMRPWMGASLQVLGAVLASFKSHWDYGSSSSRSRRWGCCQVAFPRAVACGIIGQAAPRERQRDRRDAC